MYCQCQLHDKVDFTRSFRIGINFYIHIILFCRNKFHGAFKFISSERQHADMILNSEQLPNINRTFGGGASWLDYETTSPRGTADIGTISPRNLKQKERPNSSKTMSSLSANLFLDSNDPNTAYASSPLYPSSTEDHSQRLDRFSGTITNDGMSRGNNHHVFGHHSIATPGNVFLSQPSQYDYSDEFSQHIGGGSNSMNNALSSSPI